MINNEDKINLKLLTINDDVMINLYIVHLAHTYVIGHAYNTLSGVM